MKIAKDAVLNGLLVVTGVTAVAFACRAVMDSPQGPTNATVATQSVAPLASASAGIPFAEVRQIAATEDVPTTGGKTAKFSIGKNGRPPFITLEVFGRPLVMLIDTGASRSGIDTQFKDVLGERVGSTRLETFGSTLVVDLHDAPEMNFGGITVRSDQPVFCQDFSELRVRVGIDFHGVIGMDVLKRFAVSIDFDEGSLTLSEAISSERLADFRELPLSFESHGCPVVKAHCGGREISFLVDTGTMTNCVEHALFASLAEAGEIDLGPTHTSSTAAGLSASRTGLIRTLSLDRFEHEELLCDNGFVCALGTRYLARFQFVLDFPNAKLFAKPSQGFSKPDSRGRSGLAVIKTANGFVVRQVAPHSPAELAGLRLGDEILEVDGVATNEMDLFRIGRKLSESPGKIRNLTVLRNGEQIELKLASEDRFSLNAAR